MNQAVSFAPNQGVLVGLDAAARPCAVRLEIDSSFRLRTICIPSPPAILSGEVLVSSSNQVFLIGGGSTFLWIPIYNPVWVRSVDVEQSYHSCRLFCSQHLEPPKILPYQEEKKEQSDCVLIVHESKFVGAHIMSKV